MTAGMDHSANITPAHEPTSIAKKADWKHGDDPRSHPMWEQQVELEEAMAARGAELFRQRVEIAAEKGRMATVGPVRDQLDAWLDGVSDVVRQQARHNEALQVFVRHIGAKTLAFLGLRVTLNIFGRDGAKVRKLVPALGRAVEDELRVRLLMRGTPEQRAAWKELQRELGRQRASPKRRIEKNRELTDALLAPDQPRWSLDTAWGVGTAVINSVLMATGLFELAPGEERKNPEWKPPLMLTTKDGAARRLNEVIDRVALAQVTYWPMVMPPMPWDTPATGAYWTEEVRQPGLVRVDSSPDGDSFSSDMMPKVYRAINALQSTPYRINRRTLEVFERVWTEHRWSGENASLPEIGDRKMPPRTPGMDRHRRENAAIKPAFRKEPSAKTKKEIAEWKRQASAVLAFNGRRFSRAMAVSSILQLAEKFKDFDAIYFPHNMDFRGRMYPIPAYLQPQGNDLARGLLTYADGMPITEENGGVRWLAIHVASVWGLDKESYEKRRKWTEDHEVFMRRIVADPYANNEWFTKGDKPWEFLAACYEWVDYLDAREAGKEFYSSLPIMVDGTCNGIQHLSALVRDEVGGKLVNLIPGDRPRDIYKVVAEDLQGVLEGLVTGHGKGWRTAKWWLDLCGGTLPRSLTKRQVMVLPYGGTREAFLKYTQKWLDEAHPLPQNASKKDAQHRFKAVVFLTDHLWQAVKRNVRGAEQVMRWLKECAKATNALDLPIEWIAPSGFRVRQFERQMSAKQINIKITGERYQPQIGELTDRLDRGAQLDGVAPNFIHSLDAAALVETICLCCDAGISSFTAIHDGYGTHAANMETLAVNLRQAFIEVHAVNPLHNLRAGLERDLRLASGSACERVAAMLPEPPVVGALELSLVADSPYFFS